MVPPGVLKGGFYAVSTLLVRAYDWHIETATV
jgi:hypothetical protein